MNEAEEQRQTLEEKQKSFQSRASGVEVILRRPRERVSSEQLLNAVSDLETCMELISNALENLK